MKKCSECEKIYDDLKCNQCPNCEVKPMSKETFKKLCDFFRNA